MIAVVSCDSIFGPGDRDNSVIFRSSFETNASIEIWAGYGINRSDEPCPDGGEHSARVSGGCSSPHAMLDLPPTNKDRYLTLSFWGKLQRNAGDVIFSVPDLSPEKRITVCDTSWTYYQTINPLYCPANHGPRIEMFSGGLISGAILVDLMVVEVLSPSDPVPPLFAGKWRGSWAPVEFNGLPFYRAGFNFELRDNGTGTGVATAQIITESVSFDSQWSNFDISVDAQGNLTGNGIWYFGTPLGEVIAQSPAEIHGQLSGSWEAPGSLGTGTFTFNYDGTDYSITWEVAPY